MVAVVLWLAVLPVAGRDASDYPDVSLTDLEEFRGVGITPAVAKCMWRLAGLHRGHFRDIVLECNGPRPLELWDIESRWCLDCWDHLDNAMGGASNQDRGFRLRELNELRLLLGDERYRARFMPTPAPGWMFKPMPPEPGTIKR